MNRENLINFFGYDPSEHKKIHEIERFVGNKEDLEESEESLDTYREEKIKEIIDKKPSVKVVKEYFKTLALYE
jgi:hypothetical protein